MPTVTQAPRMYALRSLCDVKHKTLLHSVFAAIFITGVLIVFYYAAAADWKIPARFGVARNVIYEKFEDETEVAEDVLTASATLERDVIYETNGNQSLTTNNSWVEVKNASASQQKNVINEIIRDGIMEAKHLKEYPLTTPQSDKMVVLNKVHHWIVMWRHPWGLPDWGPQDGTKVGNCTITYNRTKLAEASAVIFDFTALDKERMPWYHYRHPNQVFIFRTVEAPSYIRRGERRMSFPRFDRGFINWTMSYRYKSDVFLSYFEWARNVFFEDVQELNEVLAKKHNTALWVVSNCEVTPGASQRLQYVEELIRAGLPVHRYGYCFNNKQEFADMPSEQRQSYRFYLAFENAVHCEDYMTEKLWTNAIMSGRVPVIWGPSRVDVAKLVPAGSYIHADDFDSPGALAKYLLRVEANQTEYRHYFEWRVNPDQKTKEIIGKHELIREEQLCYKLQRPFARKVIPSISHWIVANETAECLQ